MVQRSPLHGKAYKVPERSSDAIVGPTRVDHNDSSSVISPKARRQHIILERWLREHGQYDLILVDRSSGKAKDYVVTEKEPQPKEVNLQEYLEIRQGHDLESPAIESSSKKRKTSHSSPQRNKRRVHRPKTPETDEDDNYVSDADDEFDGVLDGQEGEEYYSQAILVANLYHYFVVAFKMLGQLACKDIAKAWIKMGHPKKQTTHPYNGGNTKVESAERYGFAGAMKTPDYWPSSEGWEHGKGCRHQEPDHIKKPERLILLIHLLRCGHERFTLEKLMMGTAQIEREIPKNFTAKSIKILRQIYYAREQEIRYQKNDIDGDAVIHLYVPKSPAKGPKTQKSTGTWIKNEEPRRVVDKGSAETTIEDVGFGLPIEEDPVAAQMDLDSTDETEQNGTESAPASAESSIASSRLSLQSTRKLARPKANKTTKTKSPSFLSVQQQWSRQSPFTTNETPYHATASQFGGLPVQHIQHPSRKSITQTGPSPSTSVPKLRRQRASVPSHSAVPSRIPSKESEYRAESKRQDEQRHMSLSHNTCHKPSIISKSSSYPVSPPHRPVAPKSMSFSGSSTGLAGLPSDNLWQPMNSLSNVRQYGMSGSVYTDGADPNALLTAHPSDVTSSFGSDYSDLSFGAGMQTSNFAALSQALIQPSQQALDAEFRQQYPTYMTSNFGALSLGAGPSDFAAQCNADYMIEPETKFNPFNQESHYH